MNCETVLKLLPALAGGDLGLSRKDAERCTAHIADCADCAGRLTSLKNMLGLLHRTGRIKHEAKSWQDLFFPEIHADPGS